MRHQNRRRRASAPAGVSRRLALPRLTVRALLRRGATVLAVAGVAVVVTALAVPRSVSWLIDHSYFAIESVEVVPNHLGARARLALGQPRLTPEEIEAWVDLPPGISIFRVDPLQIERRLEAHPWIRRATVTRLPPRRLEVEIHEHRPLAIVRLDDYYFVDRRGALMGRLAPSDSHDLPIISGLDRGHGRTSLEVALPRVAHLLRRQRAAALLGPISEVHFDAEHGATLFPVDVHVSLAVGWDGWRQRLGRARRVLQAWRGQEDRLAAIDLTGTDTVIVRVRETPGAAEPGRSSARKTRV
jgi:cell division protein FtsQ